MSSESRTSGTAATGKAYRALKGLVRIAIAILPLSDALATLLCPLEPGVTHTHME